ncbi:MAG: Lipoprotein-releasing system ATP-binding protein LolD [Candidatus Heimdallarchaeota archaeon LC_2]|nr:MAG: Lipoprotein-releasing system ATP-binding protein LolD [Candidatus Heimdallarchaeota archaeon LC_2]
MSEEIKEQPNKSDELVESDTVLRIENLTKKFDEIVAVNNVSFDVKKGEILGIIGANGSGKTTLFNLISGVHDPTTGKIFAIQQTRTTSQNFKYEILRPFISLFNGIIYLFITLISFVLFPFDLADFKDRSKNKRKRETALLNGRNSVDIGGMRSDLIVNEFGIARTFQIVRPFKFLTTHENVTIPHVPRKTFASPAKLKSDGLRSLLDVDLGEKKNYPAFILPHGDLKRLDISRTLACDPEIILLDEPYSGLGSEDSFRITQLIKRANEEFGVTIMIVEHKLKFLSKLVTRIIVLDQGTVIAVGTPKEISENKKVISAYLGTEASQIA